VQKLKIFISSVQKEFAREREILNQHFQSDPLLSTFFEPVLFEKLSASAQAPNKVYLKEIEQSQVYLILVGQQYGYEDEAGLSPTEHEYTYARSLNLDSLAFIKGDSSVKRHEKEMALLVRIQNQLSYKRFETTEELISEVNKAFITILKHKGLINLNAFDERINDRATFEDIDLDKIETFMGIARAKRGFPLREGTPVKKVLSHMNMLYDGQLTNSALLAFSGNPQRFFPTAIVKCAHFHGLHLQKPIPDHKVIKGDVFEQVDQAVDFVLSKISVSVGRRDLSNQAPIEYEIPRAVVAETIVNAVAHRDYNSNGSVQVMLFADRLEISNPGRLDPELSIEKLKTDHASYPVNPLLAEPLYQAGYIERYGTGTGEIFNLTKLAGLREPVFILDEGFKVLIWRPVAVTGQATDLVTDHVTDHATDQATDQVTDQATDQVTDQVEELVKRLLLVLNDEKNRQEILKILDLRHVPNFRDNYLNPAIEQGFIEMTIPDKPNSPNQKYRLTAKGLELKNKLQQS
jgi:predicted HTH transcriptional regulator